MLWVLDIKQITHLFIPKTYYEYLPHPQCRSWGYVRSNTRPPTSGSFHSYKVDNKPIKYAMKHNKTAWKNNITQPYTLHGRATMKSLGKVVGFLPARVFFGPKLMQCEGSIFQEEFSRELQAYMALPTRGRSDTQLQPQGDVSGRDCRLKAPRRWDLPIKPLVPVSILPFYESGQERVLLIPSLIQSHHHH